MTILAQTFLERRIASKYDPWILARLGLPNAANPLLAAAQYEGAAERIVFVDALDELAIELHETGQITRTVVYETVRMPCECVWIEWTLSDRGNGPQKVGVLLDRDDTGDIAFAVVSHSTREPSAVGVCMVGALRPLPWPMNGEDYNCIKLTWSVTGGGLSNDERARAASLIVVDALYGLFLVQQPRVIEEEAVEHGPKLQRARAKAGKHPLVEYRRVKVTIGGETRRRALSAAGASPHAAGDDPDRARRRYHRVLGHFRIYGRGTDAPRATWIAPHFRGDPALGVLIRERDVHKAPRAREESAA